MATNLYTVFACVAMRGTENADHHFVDDLKAILDMVVVKGTDCGTTAVY